jgi:LCP family protein required for cell wall assembly
LGVLDDLLKEEPENRQHSNGDSGKGWAIGSKVLAVLTVLSPGFLVVSLAMAQLLGITYLMVAGIASGVVSIVLGAVTWLTKMPGHRTRAVIVTILSVLLIAGNIFGTKVGMDWRAFLNRTEQIPADQIQYDIVALATHEPQVTSLAGERVSLLGSDSQKDKVQTKATELIKGEVQFSEAESPSDLLTGLLAGDVDAFVLGDQFVQVLSEADENFGVETQILAKFTLTTPVIGGEPTAVPEPAPVRSDGSYIVYLSGIDTYGAVSTRSRSDVNILVAVNPNSHEILLVNTPRDYYVQLHGTTGTKDKLTHAGIYGIDMSRQTLEDLFDEPISYYIRLNFDSLIKVVDTLGGVDVDSAYAFSAGGYSFNVGLNHVDGKAALAFARERYTFASGDRQRGKNQQALIEAIIKKASEPSNLLRYNEILNSLSGALQWDIPGDQIAKLANEQISSGTGWKVSSISVDGTGDMLPTYSGGSQPLYVMIPNESTVQAARDQIDATLS